MSIRHLDALFRPDSVAVIGPHGFGTLDAVITPFDGLGASDAALSAQGADATPPSLRALQLAALLAQRIEQGGFTGRLQRIGLGAPSADADNDPSSPITPASLSTAEVFDSPLLQAPALALICTPADQWESIVGELVRIGTKAAVLYGQPSSLHSGEGPGSLNSLLAIARPGLLRLVGPASGGIVSSAGKLHASLGNDAVLPGRVALISQSRSFANAAISWASARDIGFSRVVTSGLEADVDCADLLDYLASDPATGAIALAIDFIAPPTARKFMSAARAASRNKPVLVLRARHRRPDDALFSAAFRRAGMVRVDSIEDLLDAIETLHIGRFSGSGSVTVVSNGGFTAALGADAVAEAGTRLAVLNDEARTVLSQALSDHPSDPYAPPPGQSPNLTRLSNPLNLGETADLSRYRQAIRTLAELPGSGALFVIHTPSLYAPAVALAEVVVAESAKWPRALMSCWLGDFDPAVRALLHRHKVAVYPTPQRLARAFARMREYQRNHVLLAETPESIGNLSPSDIATVRSMLQRSIHNALHAAAHDAADDEATQSAGMPIDSEAILRVMTQWLVRPSTSSGAASGAAIGTGSGVASGPPAIDQTDAIAPVMHIFVQRDPMFGMVLGVAPHQTPHHASPETLDGTGTNLASRSLPPSAERSTQASMWTQASMQTQWAILPISTVLSGDLVSRLPDAPSHGHASHRAFTRFLARLSEVIVAVPEIARLDLTAAYRSDGMRLLTCQLASASPDDLALPHRFAVRPYPAELESTLDWQGEAILIRPIKPQDEDTHRQFIDSLSAEDMRMRFFGAVSTPEHSQLARMTQIDYDREMAFIATSNGLDGQGPATTLGVVRAVADPDNDTAEFAVVVRSDRKGLHLGGLLMRRIIDYCRTRGTRLIVGEVLSENTRMVRLARRLGFDVKRTDEPGVMSLTLVLSAASTSA